LNDATAGYFNGCLGIGEAMGPIIASFLVQKLGFRSACDVLALSVLVYTILYFIFNGRSKIFQRSESSEKIGVEDTESKEITVLVRHSHRSASFKCEDTKSCKSRLTV